jgi:hypothetical protein
MNSSIAARRQSDDLFAAIGVIRGIFGEFGTSVSKPCDLR